MTENERKAIPKFAQIMFMFGVVVGVTLMGIIAVWCK